MSRKRSGWVKINRKMREDIFRKIDAHKNRGKPPRRDVARLLVYTLADHADYWDLPGDGRRRGVWRTTYAEIEALTGYSKREAERSLAFLEKLGLVRRGPIQSEKGAEDDSLIYQKKQAFMQIQDPKGNSMGQLGACGYTKTVPGELVINILFYNELTSDGNLEMCQDGAGNGAVFKEVKASKSLKRRSHQGLQVDQSSVPPKSQDAGSGSLSEKHINSKPKIQKPQPQAQLRSSSIPGRSPRKLVGRNSVPMTEASSWVPPECRPTLNKLQNLGITDTYQTHLNLLKKIHLQAMARAPKDDAVIGKTALYRALSMAQDKGQKFSTIPDALEGVKSDLC